MNILRSIYINNKYLLVIDLLFILTAIFYYIFFVNKGLVLYDEGFYAHYAERITRGETAYKDFVLQYTPGYFYLLASLYKIFGTQILVGRFLSLAFCILILSSVLLFLYINKVTSPKIHVLTALTVISLGYPLLHIPLVVWPSVFIAVLLGITYVYWYRNNKAIFLVILGFLLALSLFLRQHLGIVFLIIINGIVFLSERRGLLFKIKSLIVLNTSWAMFTTLWVYLFFIHIGNLAELFLLFEYNKKFVSTFPFSYPPLTFLLQPTGFFKLLPYYYPIIYGFFILLTVIKKQFEWEKLSFALIVLSGFFATVYPASDLLHVYPFLGLVIVSSILFFYKKKGFSVVIFLIVIFILLGFYLTFFTKSFRYEDYFLKETTPLHLPKTKGILIDKANDAKISLVPLFNFINTHTEKNDYIFVYPFAPLLYFVLDRQNPNGIVQFILLEAPESVYPEERVLAEIKEHKVKYIITVGQYKYNKKISKFIQQQNEVYSIGPYIVFEIKE